MRAERQILFWLTAALVLILAIGLLKAILLPFVAGIAIAYFLSPLADRLTGAGTEPLGGVAADRGRRRRCRGGSGNAGRARRPFSGATDRRGACPRGTAR